MELLDAIKTRKSVRRFADKQVEEAKLRKILEAVQQSPSWANLQCWRFIVVKDKEIREKLSELSYVESFFAPLGYKSNPSRKGIGEAPVAIVDCADPSQSGILWNQNYYMTDIGIASQNLMLAAHSLGLGTVFVGVFDEEKIRGLFNIPSNIRVVGIFPIGYPMEEKTKGLSRKPLNEIAYDEEWGKGVSI